MANRPVRVLVVDDSALMRQLLSQMLSSDAGIEVVGAVPDPLAARDMIKKLNPDVLTLDIEMPKMDGLAFLEKVMALRPMPVVMVSSLTRQGADATLRALELGAVDFVAKPTSDLQQGLLAERGEIIDKVKAAAQARVSRGARRGLRPTAPAKVGAGYSSTEKIVAIGASTGGVEALRQVVCELPADCPATLITQHMPPRFTAGFACRLDGLSAVGVAEVRGGERVLPGHVYIAPGGRHLELARSGADYVCQLNDGKPVCGHRPSVDVLFQSVAAAAGANAVGVILTGMGRDGAAGLLAMRRAGAPTIGQDESTSVVYGMPKVAWETGGVEEQLPLGGIVQGILARCCSASLRVVRV